MKHKNLSVIIPIHNRIHFTRSCLLSLRTQTLNDFRIIVVDDGSTDGSNEMIRSEFPEVILLHGDGNLWWTGAMNLGLQYVLERANQNDYVLTLNNDTVVRPHYLETLLSSASNHPRSLIGSVAVSDENESRVVDGGVRVNWLTAKHILLGVEKKYEDLFDSSSLITQVDVLPGRGTLIPVEVFQNIGLYDSVHLPHYGADYEFSVRAKRNGFDLLLDHKAVVVSRVSSTGLSNAVRSLTWQELAQSFISIRSPNNIRYRWNFAKLCCPRLLLPTYFILDMTRVALGTLRNQLVNQGGKTAEPNYRHEAT